MMLRLILFCLFFGQASHAKASEQISPLPDLSDKTAPYYLRLPPGTVTDNKRPPFDWLERIIVKQNNANELIKRGFPMPFNVADIDATNKKLLKAFTQGNKNEQNRIAYLYLQCYPTKDQCFETIPDDLSKFLPGITPPEKSKPALIPFPENDPELQKTYYDLILLQGLLAEADEALDRGTSHGYDSSVLKETLSADEAQNRRLRDYDDYVDAVNAASGLQRMIDRGNREDLIDLIDREAIRSIFSRQLLTPLQSGVCLRIRDDKDFAKAVGKITFRAPNAKTYDFSIHADRKTEDSPVYFVKINGVEQDNRLTERYLPDYPKAQSFFEKEGFLYLIAKRDDAQLKIFRFNPDAYVFEPACLLSADMTNYTVKSTPDKAPLCRKIMRQEYDVYPKRTITQRLSVEALEDFYRQTCGDNEECIRNRLINFRDETAVFADYDNDGREDVLVNRDFDAPLTTAGSGTLPVGTAGTTKIVRVNGKNYVLTTFDYQWDNGRKSFYGYGNDWYVGPEALYEIKNGKASAVCTFTPVLDYH